MIETKATVTFDPARVKRRVRAATFKSLGHLGGALRKTAARSIRPGKKPSNPGSPPHTQTGELRRGIVYEVDQARETVVVGPTRRRKEAIWGLLEFGGTGRRHYRRLYPGPYQTGQFGPIRFAAEQQAVGGKRKRKQKAAFGPKKIVYARLETDAQAERAAAIAQQANQERTALEQVSPHYPQRPFMGPALEKLRPRIPSFWANSVRG